MAATLVSREGLQTAKASLVPGGLLVLNTWGIDTERGKPNRVGAANARRSACHPASARHVSVLSLPFICLRAGTLAHLWQK